MNTITLHRSTLTDLRQLVATGMAIETDDGILRCLYCEADNGENDPPEDDAIPDYSEAVTLRRAKGSTR